MINKPTFNPITAPARETSELLGVSHETLALYLEYFDPTILDMAPIANDEEAQEEIRQDRFKLLSDPKLKRDFDKLTGVIRDYNNGKLAEEERLAFEKALQSDGILQLFAHGDLLNGWMSESLDEQAMATLEQSMEADSELEEDMNSCHSEVNLPTVGGHYRRLYAAQLNQTA